MEPLERPALIGDSLDWGQDLARLGAWVSRHGKEGSTLVCVYGMGRGEPYGLRRPESESGIVPDRPPYYLAVSANRLLGYESGATIEIGKRHWSLEARDRELLRALDPVDVVGRTIRIFRAQALFAGR
jgi:hypothetical protein